MPLAETHVKSDDSRRALVSALCHELGNLMAGVRLQAHILGEDLTTKELALASLELDEIGARAGALVALLRPLAGEVVAARRIISPEAILTAVEASLEGSGGRGIELSVEVVQGLPALETDAEAIVSLLVSLALGAVDIVRPHGRVRLAATGSESTVTFSVEDDASGPDFEDWPDGALRGRTLLCAIAEHLLSPFNGKAVVNRGSTGTCIELVLESK